jgi:hypothetical protein
MKLESFKKGKFGDNTFHAICHVDDVSSREGTIISLTIQFMQFYLDL